MGKKKRKFTGVSFQLVHRSQRDPLVTDENAPQHVLEEIKPKTKPNREEQIKYGIYFDDDYDYLQHLKDPSQKLELVEVPKEIKQKKPEKGLNLPSSVFPSEVEEYDGVMNRAPKSGLRLDLDPDVIAALDDDFDFDDPENMLEDDFILKANATPDGSDCEYEGDEEDLGSDFGSYEMGSQGGMEYDFPKEETKSRFTNYSMTSSVIRRNDQLTILDDKFSKMYAEYDEPEIGALDCEEIEGEIDTTSDMLVKMADDYVNDNKPVPFETQRLESIVESESESDVSYIEVKEKEKWDCESILSTYSNLFNHPKVIPTPKIKINPRTGIPVTSTKLTAKALSKLDEDTVSTRGPRSLASMVSLLSIRSKDESAEEKRARKKAVKEHRKMRITERKMNTAEFSLHKKKMEKMTATNKTRFQIPLSI